MKRTFLALLLAFVTCVATPSASNAVRGDCGQPISTGDKPTVADCLFILKSAIAAEECIPPCVCDTTGDADITAGDALLCLKKAVGQDVPLACVEPCPPVTTSTSTTSSSTSSSTSTVTFPTSTTTLGAQAGAEAEDALLAGTPEQGAALAEAQKGAESTVAAPAGQPRSPLNEVSAALLTLAHSPAPALEMCSLEL